MNTPWQSGIIRWEGWFEDVSGVLYFSSFYRVRPSRPVDCCTRRIFLVSKLGPTESQVKAAYLFNFGKFVSWQADRSATPESFEICVLGRDPFGTILDATVSGESIDGKKITIAKPANIQQANFRAVIKTSAWKPAAWTRKTLSRLPWRVAVFPPTLRLNSTFLCPTRLASIAATALVSAPPAR